jgi:MraZ protein
MEEFASRFETKVDGRGRIAVPAQFRSVLAKEGAEDIHCYPHLDQRAVEAGGPRLVHKIKGILAELPADAPLRESLELVYFGESEKLKVDPDGRTILSQRLRDHAGITDTAVFVGLGDKFQIWAPEPYDRFREASREQARAHRRDLGAGNR